MVPEFPFPIGLKLQYRSILLRFALCVGLAFVGQAAAADVSIPLRLPVDCEVGKTCFLQQMTDMDTGPGARDPFCGGATYDGHKGTDIRIRSLADIAKNIPVVAAADGMVKAFRDGEADQLVQGVADRERVRNVECGNGVLIDHGNGIETQYCHMKKGSIAVVQGQKVLAGEPIGTIGTSGMAQFPHLHLTVRRNGRIVDPFTGKEPEQGCSGDVAQTWWQDDTLLKQANSSQLIGAGLAGEPVNHDELVMTGGPPTATPRDNAIVGWVWFINLRAGDLVALSLEGPDGLVARNTSQSLDRNKASWSAFVGKRQPPQPGRYVLRSHIIRNGKEIDAVSKIFTIN